MSEWIDTTVRDVVVRCYSGPSPTCEERNIQSPEEWGLLKTTAITWTGWNESAHKVPPRGYWHNKAIEVHPGDILITKAGPRHRVGVVVHVPVTQARLMVSGKMIGLTPNTATVFSRVLAGVLATQRPQKYLDHRTTGMAESQVNFTNQTLLSTPVCLPPIREQRVIAQILDTVDAAIRSTETLIAKLVQMKQGLLHDLLTRGVDDAGKLRDPVRSPKDFASTRLGPLPSDWQVTTLGAVIASGEGFIQTGPFGSQLHAHEYVSDGVPVVMPQDIYDGEIEVGQVARVTEEKARSLPRHRMQTGDVVFARRGDLSKCAAVQVDHEGWLCGTGSLLVRPALGLLAARWLAAFYGHDLSQRQIAAAAVGSTMVNLNSSLLGSLVLALPPRDEQDRIVAAMDAYRSRIDTAAANLEKLRSLKNGLMDDLLTGRVRVDDQETA